jgi:hypothetical protein
MVPAVIGGLATFTHRDGSMQRISAEPLQLALALDCRQVALSYISSSTSLSTISPLQRPNNSHTRYRSSLISLSVAVLPQLCHTPLSAWSAISRDCAHRDRVSRTKNPLQLGTATIFSDYSPSLVV